MRWTTGQPRLSAIVQARRLSLFGHIARMPDETDARSIITASASENWRRPPGRPRTTWMKTIQQDLRSNNLSLDEAITVAQNRPLWRLMSAFGATHPWWCMPHKRKKKDHKQSSQRRLLQVGTLKIRDFRRHVKHSLLMSVSLGANGWSFHTVDAEEWKLC